MEEEVGVGYKLHVCHQVQAAGQKVTGAEVALIALWTPDKGP